MVDWAKHHLSTTLQVSGGLIVGGTASLNLNYKGVDLCYGVGHSYGLSVSATADYYGGPDLKGLSTISSVSRGAGFGQYADFTITSSNGYPEAGGGGGFGYGVGLYAGTNIVNCTGRVSYPVAAKFTNLLI